MKNTIIFLFLILHGVHVRDKVEGKKEYINIVYNLGYPTEIQFLAGVFQLLWSLKSTCHGSIPVFLNHKLCSQNQRPN